MKIKEEIIKEAIKGNMIKQKDNDKNIILEVLSVEVEITAHARLSHTNQFH